MTCASPGGCRGAVPGPGGTGAGRLPGWPVSPVLAGWGGGEPGAVVLLGSHGGPAVMAAQLAHIGQMAGQPNVTVQVLPFTAGAHPAMLGSFTLMQFPDPADKDVVYLEAETGALYLEKPEDVRRYSLMIDYLRAQALGPAESRALIAQMAGQSPD